MRLVLSTLVLCALATGCEQQQQPTTTPEPAAVAPAKPVKPIPENFFAVTPQLTVVGVDTAVDFYVKALGAEKLFALPGPDGKTIHAEVKIGDSIVMIDEQNLEQGAKAPTTLGGTPATLMVYVPDADAAFATAVAAGATAERPIEEQFWGDRYGQLIDPAGHRWALATHVEDLTPEQMQQRGAIVMAEMDPKAKKKKKKHKKGAPPAWKAIAGTPATAPVPPPYHTVTVALTTDDAAKAIEFYKTALGATERDRMVDPSGKIMHAELAIGDSFLMLSDEYPAMGSKAAKTLGGSPVALMFYTEDVDAAYAKATGAGATAALPVADMFWGDRYGAVLDAAGYLWGIATHKEDLTPEQIAERAKAAMPAAPAAAAEPAPAGDAAATPAAATPPAG